MAVTLFAPGNYRYIPAFFQYSAGVAADPGYGIARVTLREALPLADGFRFARAHIEAAGRPVTAFCACELRSPVQFTDAGFKAFNEHYCETLAAWGIYDPVATTNPVARSNVCPEIDGPKAPQLYAFSFTVPEPSASAAPAFVISGSGESRPGTGDYATRIVRYGETSADAMRAKARHVLAVLAERAGQLGYGWANVSGTQVYTIHDLHPFLADEIVACGAAKLGLTWHYARPPVQGLEFEMDCRSVADERVV